MKSFDYYRGIITASKARRDERERDEYVCRQEKENSLKERIRSLHEHIEQIVNVGRVLYDNGLPLGTPTYNNKHSFVTEGIYHKLGLFVVGSPTFDKCVRPYAIGYEGGGVDGPDFKIDINGNVVDGHKHLLQKGEKFLSEFPVFEQDFYAYVESLGAK